MLTAQPLAGIVDDIQTVIQKGEKYLGLIVEVLEDPALPTVAAQVQTLRRMTKSSGSSTSSGGKSTTATKGVGLSKAVTPLNAYIWTRQHKAATWAIIAGAVLVPVGLGVVAGRLSKRCGAPRR